MYHLKIKELLKKNWGVINNSYGLTPKWGVQFGPEYAVTLGCCK